MDQLLEVYALKLGPFFYKLNVNNSLKEEVMDLDADFLELSSYKSPDCMRLGLLHYRDCPELARRQSV